MYFSAFPVWATKGVEPYEGLRAQTEADGLLKGEHVGQPEPQDGNRQAEPPLSDIARDYARVKQVCYDLANLGEFETELEEEVFWQMADEEYDQLTERVTAETNEHQARARKSWREWVEDAVGSGGRDACNFAKGPHPWTPAVHGG